LPTDWAKFRPLGWLFTLGSLLFGFFSGLT
jgi:hypothetical protein